MLTYPYGHDFGNSESGGATFIHGQKCARSVPSAISQGSLAELDKLGAHIGPNHFVYRYANDSTEQYIGELALQQASMSFSGRGDISRYWSEKSLAALLTVSSSLIPDAEYSLNVVTGLPVQTYLGDEDCRRKVRAALEGRHAFYVNDRPRVAYVKVSKVIMEGAGAIVVHGLQSQVVQGVIDIGGRTTDLFASEGQQPLRHMCGGKPIGVEYAGDLLAENFQKRYGRALKGNEVRRALREHVSNTRLTPLIARGSEVPDLDALIRDALKQVGNEVASFVASKWNESETGSEVASSFTNAFCIGGGAHYFYHQLKELIPQLVFIKVPEEANACGYALLAQQQLQQHLRIA